MQQIKAYLKKQQEPIHVGEDDKKKISIETEFQPVTDSSKTTKQNTCANPERER